MLKTKRLLDNAFKKVDSDRLLVVASEDAFAEALDHARLAHGAVAHNHHLWCGTASDQKKYKNKLTLRSISRLKTLGKANQENGRRRTRK